MWPLLEGLKIQTAQIEDLESHLGQVTASESWLPYNKREITYRMCVMMVK